MAKEGQASFRIGGFGVKLFTPETEVCFIINAEVHSSEQFLN